MKKRIAHSKTELKDERVKMTTVLHSINSQHHQHQLAKVTAKSRLIKTEIRDIKSHQISQIQIMFTYQNTLQIQS